MKIFTSTLCTTILAFQFAPAQDQTCFTYCEEHYMRIYAGPDLFREHFGGVYTHEGQPIYYKMNAYYAGVKIGYDWLKPEAFYFGGEGMAALGRSIFRQKTSGNFHFRNRRAKKVKNSPLITNLEQRIGYTFESPIACGSTLTPFVGIGWYHKRLRFNRGASANFSYAAFGLRGQQQFIENFDVGFHAKALLDLDCGNWKIFVYRWGYEFSLPLTWYQACYPGWDIQLQPYVLKLNTEDGIQIVGARILIGCTF